MNRSDAVGNHYIVGNEWVESRNLHAKTLGNASHVATNLTIGMNTESLTLEFETGLAAIFAANHHNGHTKHEFGNSIRVLTRSVHYAHAVSCGFSQIDIVVTGAGANHNFKLLCSI